MLTSEVVPGLMCVYTLTLTHSLTAHPNAARGLNEGARKAIYFARIEPILFVWHFNSILSRRVLELSVVCFELI